MKFSDKIQFDGTIFSGLFSKDSKYAELSSINLCQTNDNKKMYFTQPAILDIVTVNEMIDELNMIKAYIDEEMAYLAISFSVAKDGKLDRTIYLPDFQAKESVPDGISPELFAKDLLLDKATEYIEKKGLPLPIPQTINKFSDVAGRAFYVTLDPNKLRKDV